MTTSYVIRSSLQDNLQKWSGFFQISSHCEYCFYLFKTIRKTSFTYNIFKLWFLDIIVKCVIRNNGVFANISHFCWTTCLDELEICNPSRDIISLLENDSNRVFNLGHSWLIYSQSLLRSKNSLWKQTQWIITFYHSHSYNFSLS